MRWLWLSYCYHMHIKLQSTTSTLLYIAAIGIRGSFRLNQKLCQIKFNSIFSNQANYIAIALRVPGSIELTLE